MVDNLDSNASGEDIELDHPSPEPDDDQTDSGRPISFWVSLFLGFLLVISAGLNMLLIIVTISSAGQFGPSPSARDFQEETLQGSGKDKVLVVPIKGTITDQSSGGVFGSQQSPVDKVQTRLDRAVDQEEVKGVIIRVNSPGGGVTASDQIYHEIKQFKKKRPNVTVLSYMENVAASGGYYVSAPADYIMAHRTCITGSIGVLMQFFVVEGLLKKWDVNAVTITPENADKKSIGSPFKQLEPEEREIFQGIVEKMYEQFVSVTQEGRDQLSREEVLKLADGRIYHAEEAVQNGLIDQTGYFDDAVKKVKEMQDLDTAKVVKYKTKRTLFDAFRSTMRSGRSPRLTSRIKRMLTGEQPPEFLYLWSPRQQIQINR
jgi:protease-4